MGAETRVRGWRWRALALFEVLALVALLGLQGAAPLDAAAGRNQDHRERSDGERDCPATEGDEIQPDRGESDDGEESVTVAVACPEDADAEEDDVEDAQGRHHEADEAEAHQGDHVLDEGDDAQNDESDTEESHEPIGPESDGADGDESDEAGGRESDETDIEPEADELHGAEQPDPDPADDAERLDVSRQPGDDAEPGAISGEAAEDESSAPAETDRDQGEQVTDTTGEKATPESQHPTNQAGGSSGGSHHDDYPRGAGSGGSPTGGSGSGGPGVDRGASWGGPGNAGPDAEEHDIEPGPIAAAAPVSGYDLQGFFSTTALLDALPSRRALRSRERIPQIAPFIIAGPASWTDTWGAPRSGPGSLARRHEGQDVFCRYGDPVLASERGYVEFDEGGLGGKVARLHRADGSYWYYAHLSAWNTRDVASGDRVVPGDVIGYCGNSGNAIGSPPHVHFGLYGSNGRATNPVRDLVRWLRAAEGGLGLERLGRRDSNRDASGDPALKRSSEAILVQRLPRLDGTGDAFGDLSAGLKSTRTHELLASSSVPLEAALALAAVAMLMLWGILVREMFSSARS